MVRNLQIILSKEDAENLEALLIEYTNLAGPFSDETVSGREWISFLNRLDAALYSN